MNQYYCIFGTDQAERRKRLREIVLEGPVGPEVTVWGRKFLFFGGTDYLGMAGRAEVLEGARAALGQYGMSSAGSRTSSGTNQLHLQLERVAGRFFECGEAVVLPSGYLAMSALLSAVARGDDLVLVQRGGHPSLVDAARVSGLECRGFDCSPQGLELALTGLPERRRVLLMAEGVAPLYGTIFPLEEILARLDGREFLVLLDDAHALGVLGGRGRGTAEHHGRLGDPRVLSCATLSKALGAFGGVAPLSRELAAGLRARALSYIGSTPPPAPVLGAALAAFECLEREPALLSRLRENAARLKDGLRALGLSPDGPSQVPIAPIVLEDPRKLERLYARLLEEGILAPLLNYPGTPAGGMIRAAVSSSHSAEQIDRFLECLRGVR